MITRRATLALLPSAVLMPRPAGAAVDLDPEQRGRIRARPVPEAIALLPRGFPFVAAGKLTLAHSTGRLPFATYATDTKTPVGSEPDIAQLVADSLGLQLASVPIAWADWPLGLVSRKYDAVLSNVTVTEERKEKFDFSTYRQDALGFYVPKASGITSIAKPEDVAGLRVIVGSGTNQEQLLLRWSEANKAKGLKPTELQYHDDDAVRVLALQSGRADAYLGPNALAAFEAQRDGTTRKGSGLAGAVTAALNAQIKAGPYGEVLGKWNLTAEAIPESRTNPPGLPRT